eukprot:5690644-Ditylum_brightwellii.AAC.1
MKLENQLEDLLFLQKAEKKSHSRSLCSTGSIEEGSRGSRSNMSTKNISLAPVRCVSNNMSTPIAHPRINTSSTTTSWADTSQLGKSMNTQRDRLEQLAAVLYARKKRAIW